MCVYVCLLCVCVTIKMQCKELSNKGSLINFGLVCLCILYSECVWLFIGVCVCVCLGSLRFLSYVWVFVCVCVCETDRVYYALTFH